MSTVTLLFILSLINFPIIYSNTVVIFIHGLFGSNNDFNPMISSLKSEDPDGQFFALDLNNHWDSMNKPIPQQINETIIRIMSLKKLHNFEKYHLGIEKRQ